MVQRREPDFHLQNIPMDDPAVFEMLSQGKTERRVSDGVDGHDRRVYGAASPQSIEDITAIIALYRPGPMDVYPEVHRLQARPEARELQAPDRSTRSSSVTYGCIVYQEQVIKIFQRAGRATRSDRPTWCAAP